MPLKEPPFGTVTYFRLRLSHLSVGLHSFMAIPHISASPDLSGPWRAATLIRRSFTRGVSPGTIMPDPGGRDKGKSGRR